MQEFIIFLKTFFGTPAILVGLIALIGLIIQRKTFGQIVTGTFKVIIGFLVLGGGAALLQTSLDQFSPVFMKLFQIQGAIPNNEATLAQLLKLVPQIVSIGTGIMLVAMIANVILAITSRFKYIYLTGHVLFYMSVMLAAALVAGGMDQTQDLWNIILTGGLLMSFYMILMPLANQRFMRTITKGDIIAMGHTGSISYLLSGWIGEAIGKMHKKPVKSTESVNFPKGLAFLKSSNVSISLTMMLFFMIIYITTYAIHGVAGFAGTGVVDANGAMINHWFVWAIIQSFTFAAGIEVILLGVRLILNELVPAFKGISEKFVKGGKAALDCAVVFTYAPNAVLIGFLSSFVAGVIGMFITYGAGLPIVLPGIAAHFFLGATSGVFGNAKGGIWGAIVGPFVQGLIITFVPIAFLKLNGYAGAGDAITTGWGDTDYLLGILPLLITKYAGKWAIFGITIGAFLAFIASEQIILGVKRARNKKISLVETKDESLKVETKVTDKVANKAEV